MTGIMKDLSMKYTGKAKANVNVFLDQSHDINMCNEWLKNQRFVFYAACGIKKPSVGRL